MVDQVLDQQEQLVASYEQLRAAHDQLQRQSDSLREIQARNAAVVENTAELILICDEQGRMTFANQTARRLLLDLPKRRWPIRVFRFVQTDDRARALKVFQAAVRSDRTQRAEFRLVHPHSGEIVWLETSAQRFQAAGGGLRRRRLRTVLVRDRRKRSGLLRRGLRTEGGEGVGHTRNRLDHFQAGDKCPPRRMEECACADRFQRTVSRSGRRTWNVVPPGPESNDSEPV